jgi:hypothetical protein
MVVSAIQEAGEADLLEIVETLRLLRFRCGPGEGRQKQPARIATMAITTSNSMRVKPPAEPDSGGRHIRSIATAPTVEPVRYLLSNITNRWRTNSSVNPSAEAQSNHSDGPLRQRPTHSRSRVRSSLHVP